MKNDHGLEKVEGGLKRKKVFRYPGNLRTTSTQQTAVVRVKRYFFIIKEDSEIRIATMEGSAEHVSLGKLNVPHVT